MGGRVAGGEDGRRGIVAGDRGRGGVEVEEEGKVEVEPEIEVIGAAGGSPTQTIQPMKVIMI